MANVVLQKFLSELTTKTKSSNTVSMITIGILSRYSVACIEHSYLENEDFFIESHVKSASDHNTGDSQPMKMNNVAVVKVKSHPEWSVPFLICSQSSS